MGRGCSQRNPHLCVVLLIYLIWHLLCNYIFNNFISKHFSIAIPLSLQAASNGFNDFCIKNISLAKLGRKEIQLAEQGG